MGNSLQTRWKGKATEGTICGKRLHAKGQHRRDLRSDSSGHYVENLADIGTTQEPQHLHVRHTIRISQHTSTIGHHNTCQTTTRMRSRRRRQQHTLETQQLKQLYGLRDSPQLSSIPKQLGLRQLRSNQCVYHDDDITVMVYVDDLLLIGDDDKIKTFRQKLESQLQLKHITKLQRDQPLVFLGRQIEYYITTTSRSA
eukprot:4976724-Amphidinium_carterae.1